MGRPRSPRLTRRVVVFFGGDYRVLRGGSFGTDPAAVRATFRNRDHPVRRQIFAGFRLAWDA
jgi:gamma-glutamyl hercynylcysteine S-oxide synthase